MIVAPPDNNIITPPSSSGNINFPQSEREEEIKEVAINEMPTVPQSAYLSLLGSQIFPSNIANASQIVIPRRVAPGSSLGAFAAHSKSYLIAPNSVEGEGVN